MADSSEGVIKEGFICPICHVDMRSPKILLTHFQEQHSDEQDILKSLKELVGKAKSKILKLDDRDLEVFKAEFTLQKYFIDASVPQEVGHTKSYTTYFKEIRRDRLDHKTSETNKLIIRLDRFLRSEGSDRKQVAQELVTWLDGTIVNRCPSCAASFNLTRRQHHCRLCGSIMCNSCSAFLTYEEARCIVSPMYSDSNAINHKHDHETLRICMHCKGMLDCRQLQQINQNMQPPICKLYEYLHQLKSDIQYQVDLFCKMNESLISGDTKYQLQDAQSLKQSIAKQSELLDSVSKKIIAATPNPENPKELSLQKSIRRATSHFIKDSILTLPILPTPSELERIMDERSQRYNASAHTSASVSVKKVTVATGWSPATFSTETPTEALEDPLMEQINIVRNYIDQARKAQRFEEVSVLMENLTMLKDMYKQQHSKD